MQHGTFSAGIAPGELLRQSLQYIKGVGPVRSGLLKRLQLETLQDLLFHFPTEHRDRAVLYARLECFGPALADLEKYLELEPNAEDAEAVRENVEQLRPLVRSIN